MIKKFDLKTAIEDEEYARKIRFYISCYQKQNGVELNERVPIYYDDVIFILSCMYSSSADFLILLKVIESNKKIFFDLLYFADIYHCLDYDDAVEEVTNDIIPDYIHKCNRRKFKLSCESREWVKKRMSPQLLKEIFKNMCVFHNDTISVDKLIFIINQTYNGSKRVEPPS